jgi:hypothetical protein
MKKIWLPLVILIIALIIFWRWYKGGGGVVFAGHDVVVINDLNVFDNTAAKDTDNVKLYRNLVSYSGAPVEMTRILVQVGHGYPCVTNNTCIGGVSPPTFETVMAMGGTYSVFEGTDATQPLTSIPNDIKVVILWLPMTAYSAAEVEALSKLIQRGGRVVIAGERGGIGAAAAYYQPHRVTVDALLTALGLALQTAGGEYDCPADNNAHVKLPPASVKSHQVTTGMGGLMMSCASALTLGPKDAALFLSTDQQKVIGAVARP